MKNILIKRALGLIMLTTVFLGACQKDDETVAEIDPDSSTEQPFDIDALSDTYRDIAASSLYKKWGPYNTHDPSVIKDGEWFYSYSTDVAYGAIPRVGIMVRKSKDLVNWQFLDWALNGLPAMGVDYVTSNGATPTQGLWAPYIMKVGSEFRLYYSLAPTEERTSAIGLLTSNSPEGPWVEKGLAVTSVNEGPGTNAIDPSVVVTPSGEHWMVYGSSWDGLFVLQLNPATGLALQSGDKGTRIARRGWTGGMVNGNLEGPEIIYNSATNKYYLFVAYDWLSTKYNVRVFRSDNPNGPFLDWNGVDVDNLADNGPMILSPYKFMNHGGWQGVSHCAVFQDNGQYFMAHQGRPTVDPAFMVMHVRKIFWTPDGWPMVSPERYANVEQTPVSTEEIAGDYEQIVLWQPVIPGFGNEQIDPNLSIASITILNSNGTINNDPNNTWTYEAPWLELRWGGVYLDKLYVSRARDWENKIPSTIAMTGFNGEGTAIWLKKVE
ncbi:arabinan endo-1,5-alpha-L-arabinosidase [Pontibacter silvestris]|uniref:Arabinan endo-1,5-alpha-L-arabinosidase n=1 Tax=Pontibacter silvestris TaxID=2305183 RepID=A0ABW4X2A4_9BACT|nr:arabinan endo-1,5-alpha-L-arabinosidase [Pontibacter silvestris]MCC9134898.1 arabinan endo-1,5-alpha-L-arabinosidase [Pontibacter silvestris]